MDDYKYKDIELFPVIFAEIMIQLYMGQTFTRFEAIKNIVAYHLENGGVTEKPSYIGTFKHATKLIRQNESYNCILENVVEAKGVWRLSPPQKDNNQSNTTVVEETNTTKEIGQGEQMVYVYYYPVYRQIAQLKGESSWCCKVGMTTRNIWDRIYSQAGTAFPEEPFVALIIKCDDAHSLELIIHKILKMRNQYIETAPGKEWFITSPNEVKEIYEKCLEKYPDGFQRGDS